jgi:predicted metal-dependent peptidase
VDWREVLRQFIKVHLRDRDSPSWRKAHKRYLWQDIILPSIIGKRIKRLGVCIDTSGSVKGELLMAFLTELNSVIRSVNPDQVDVLYWDTEVNGHETYKGSMAKEVIGRTKPVGGGGTSPDCLPPYMESKRLQFDAIVMLTDGYMSAQPRVWASVTAPVLWCLIGNKDFPIPCGKVVHITED